MIYVVDLESIPTRYTSEWKWFVPQWLQENGLEVTVIEGDQEIPEMTTPGAFLNFGGTNMYKATQVHQISRLFVEDKIQDGDQFVFTDAWHPGVINIKYMSKLLGKDITLHGLWHAGSYDPNDFLGRLIGNEKWIRNAEASFFEAFDYNWVATYSHEKQIRNVFPDVKLHHTGWPMSYTRDLLDRAKQKERKPIIVFPHRIAPEKRLDLFEELSKRPELSHYEFRVPMQENLTKDQYHNLLGTARFAVSFAEQETLGISMYEAACAGAVPIVPNRLSYVEMYYDGFKTDGTVDAVVNKILELESHDLQREANDQANLLHEHFFSATKLLNKLKEINAR
jgi:glycosyltransferase involved in cell wall biosynthesis